jgi:mono/diheme cytochrome c family protein
MWSRSLDKNTADEFDKEMRVMNWAEREAGASREQRMEANEAQRVDSRITLVRRPVRFIALFLFVFAALLFGLPAARAQQSSDAPANGNAQNGKKLFMSDGCYECHGRQGQGAAQTGAARIGPPQLSFDGFQSYVRSPKNNMPPYTSKALPDADLADIYAYLKSIPMPPKGKDIPLLNK